MGYNVTWESIRYRHGKEKKINAKISTEAELIGADDALP